MSRPRLIALTALTMAAFASNSLLCRQALKHTALDAAGFTTIRLVSGAVMLALIARARPGLPSGAGSWPSALALAVYAAAFSFAYVSLPASTGALLLFGAVQATMIGHGVWTGERLRRRQIIGLVLASGGLVGLLAPGLSAPPLFGALLMLSAGVAWGVYSLRGRGTGDPIRVTASNFLRGVPMVAIVSVFRVGQLSLDGAGIAYAIASGALASGIGYAIWYTALPSLAATHAATVQLSVPVLAALGGVAFLGESVTPRLALASTAILGGIALVILERQPVVEAETRQGEQDQMESATKAPPSVLGLWGVRYQVRDVQRSILFYTQTLGFHLDLQNLPAFGQVSIGDLKLILSGPGASGSRQMPDGRQQEPGGWNRAVLRVKDLPAVIAELENQGVRFRNAMEVGPGGRQILVEDPDGNLIELFEPAER